MIFLWIILYGLVYRVCTAVEGAPWALLLGMVAYTAGFLLWICASGFRSLIRLNKMHDGIQWQLLPLLIPAAGNWLLNSTGFPGWEEGIVLICASVTEELFFRGFLFQYLWKKGPGKAVLGTSLVFSLMHLSNLLGGAELGYTLAQVVFGFWAGICYCLVILRWNSLLPCILAHGLTNLTATVPASRYWLLEPVCYCAIYFIYSLWLYQNIRNQKKEIIP